MDRRGISVLLVPLLAAIALFYPGMRQTPAREVASALQSFAERQLSSGNAKSQASNEWSRGPEMVRQFLDAPVQGEPQWPAKDRRRNSKIDFLIATLPDPIESGLPHQFDRLFSSVQSALQGGTDQHFVLTSFDLPWLECLKKQGDGKAEDKDKSGGSPSSNCGNNPRYAQVPGVALFNEPGAAAKALAASRSATGAGAQTQPAAIPEAPPPETHLLLLYVIGETPTSGIHKTAMAAALSELAWFCGFGHGDNHALPQWLQGKSSCGEIRVVGPTFSGSAQSLDFALSSWLDSFGELPVVSFNIISGSATAVRPWFDFLNLKRISDAAPVNEHGKHIFDFHSMEASNRTSFGILQQYIEEIQPCGTRRRIALLTEGNTVYGQTTGSKVPRPESPSAGPCGAPTEVTSIPFPLHISQLRSALERLKGSQPNPSPQAPTTREALPLEQSLEEVNQGHDSVPPTSQVDTATAELVMANLLSTISQEKYHYVGILATDVRDVIFLAKEIREHCPQTIVFTFNPDLLFLHPDENPSLRGMLLVTTYPLFSFNQLWSPPYFASDSLDPGVDEAPPRARFQFADEGAEGVYLATLALLGSEQQMLEFGLPFDNLKTIANGQFRPPLWITVVGRNRMWPVKVYDLNARKVDLNARKVQNLNFVNNAKWYLYGVAVSLAGDSREEKKMWWRGLYPSGALVVLSLVSIFSLTFCGLVLRKRRGPGVQHASGPELVLESASKGNPPRSHPDEAPLRPRREIAYLLAACASLTAFLTVALSALLVPVIVMWHVGASFELQQVNEWGWAVGVIALGCVTLFTLLFTSGVFLVALIRQAKQDSAEKSGHEDPSSWLHIAAGSAAIFSLCLWLGLSSIVQASPSGEFRTALFSSMRSLYLLSGVSPLLPVFLVSMAGFVWAIGCYMRVRALEALEGGNGFLPLGFELGEISTLEKKLRALLYRSALLLPKASVVAGLVMTAAVYLYLAFVRSVEAPSLYLLLFVSFVLVNLVLWLGVLRFFCVWRQMQHLLRQVSWTPLGAACGRFRKNLPSLPKIDLASPAPTLTPLMHSVEYARALCERARSFLLPQNPGVPFSIGNAQPATAPVDPLELLGSPEFCGQVTEAEKALAAARQASANGLSELQAAKKRESQDALSDVTAEVSAVLQDSWWNKIHDTSVKKPDDPPTRDDVFRLGEDYVVGRLASLLAHVLPQMQNLIVTSVAGLLLMLFAVSSYPFQPHDILLLFNWTGILAFVGIAMWVFIQMNRDPVLSSLNGTKPGQINWNKEFVIRIVVYGIVPILALLGAQFPHSIGQLITRFMPAEAMHQ